MPRRSHISPQTVRLLEALLARPGQWHYGYELSKQTGLSSGTLYPILLRLADQHLLETRWERPQRPGLPARHTYRLTADGRQLAIERLARPAATRRAPARPAPDGVA
jgi:PadR family transcriptional regulator, regulatory protein PadR